MANGSADFLTPGPLQGWKINGIGSLRGGAGLDLGSGAVLNLLAVEFEPTDTPSGVVKLLFSGGGVVRLEVECLEVELADLGPTWAVDTRPAHIADGPDARG